MYIAMLFKIVTYLTFLSYCSISFAWIPSQKLLKLAKNANLSPSIIVKVAAILETGDKKHAKLSEKASNSKRKLMSMIKEKANDKDALLKELDEYTQALKGIEYNKYNTLFDMKQIMTVQEWQKIISASENIQKQ